MRGGDAAWSFQLDGERTLVGRGSQCDLRIASPHVSRQQCELIRQGDQLVLENLGSVNVTYLNDRPIDRVYVQDGDLITFCDIALRVSLAQPGGQPEDPDRTVAYQSGQLPPGAVPQPSSPMPPMPPMPGVPAPSGQPTTAPPVPPAGAPMAQPMSHGVPAAGGMPQPGAAPPGMTGGGPPGPPPGMPGGRPLGAGRGGAPRTGPPGARRPNVAGGRSGRPGAAGGGKQEFNLPLIRNVSVAMAVLVVLVVVAGKFVEDTEEDDAVVEQTEEPEDELPTPERKGRTDQDIIESATAAYGVGEEYFSKYRVSDTSLPVALQNFRKSKAELKLVPEDKWPEFASDLDPSIEAVEEKIDKVYKEIRISYLVAKDNEDWVMAKDEMERVLVLIPDKRDTRHKFASDKIKAVKNKMAQGGKKKGPLR